ncbi:Transcriptional regulator, TetR family protein [Enhygromyxa salina]|uniref:Transcriptional regulator, TetR family protein n=1 Tax=Enhygromyxa salina TaxID=215803 RepID=A0A0C2CQG8_9BACT|nr:Transcriptional regulator, TetR family protein [Enhygromyxa salina]
MIRKVLAATLAEIASAGYHGLRIEEVATRAGVNKTTVYRRWATKQKLVRDALLSITTDNFVAPDTGSLRGDLLKLARRLAALAAEPQLQGVFRMLFAEGGDPELVEIAGTLRQAIELVPREVFAAAKARGEIGPSVDTALLFQVLDATLKWWLLLEGKVVDDAKMTRLIDLLLDGALSDVSPKPGASKKRRRASARQS